MKTLIIIALLVAFSSCMPVFAQSSSQFLNDLERLKSESWGHTQPISYAVFYVTSKDACSDQDYAALKYYKVIADEYLSMYGIQHDMENSLCIPVTELPTNFASLTPSALPIVIMDDVVGHKLLYQEGYYGLYTISGTGRDSILVCACDQYVESLAGGWTLSHELSHFALHYYGADSTISVGWVHYVQALENQCQNFDFTKVCPDYSTAVTSPTGNEIPVMEIYGQGSTPSLVPSNAPKSDVMLLPESVPTPSVSTPEFGPLVGIIVLISVVGVVVITRRINC